VKAVAAVLAAGAGTRFGETKQLAPLDGQPLVTHAVVAALEAGLGPVLVVVGHDARAVAQVLPDSVTVVPNPWYSEGQATSLHVAVEAAMGTDAQVLVVLLGDEPGVEPQTVRDVVGTCADGAEIARAVYTDRPGHPVAFARSVWPRLLRTDGDTGARPVLDELDVTTVAVRRPAPRDVDTPADLAEVERSPGEEADRDTRP
jgi:CTP:molybdopterin cytidylyltransferase MocA